MRSSRRSRGSTARPGPGVRDAPFGGGSAVSDPGEVRAASPRPGIASRTPPAACAPAGPRSRAAGRRACPSAAPNLQSPRTSRAAKAPDRAFPRPLEAPGAGTVHAARRIEICRIRRGRFAVLGGATLRRCPAPRRRGPRRVEAHESLTPPRAGRQAVWRPCGMDCKPLKSFYDMDSLQLGNFASCNLA